MSRPNCGSFWPKGSWLKNSRTFCHWPAAALPANRPKSDGDADHDHAADRLELRLVAVEVVPHLESGA